MLLCMYVCEANAQVPLPPQAIPIGMHYGYVDPTGTLGPEHRSPETAFYVYQDDHTLYFGEESHAAFTLTLLDEDGVVWQTYVEATATSVDLPASLSGNYQLRLSYNPDFYFYSGITL